MSLLEELQGKISHRSLDSDFGHWLHTAVPKVELHAHLNGSLSPQLINELIHIREARVASDAKDTASRFCMLQENEDLEKILEPSERYPYAFKVFDIIYSLMDNLEFTKLAVEDVLCSYAAEGTWYLEIRTSLREMKQKPDSPSSEPLASRRQYVETVCESIQRVQREGPSPAALHRFYRMRKPWEESLSEEGYRSNLLKILQRMNVSLLLSINRARSAEVAEETIDIALEVGKQLVGIDSSSAVPLKIVGIDYCGDCYKGTFSDFIPALKRAKENGLQLSIHCGEKDDNEEIRQMLSVGPSRLGHLCFISSELQEVVQQSRIPAEFCITSNILTSNLGHASDHHLLNWFCHNETTPKDLHSVFPFSINTDDRGVFYTSMTKELCLFAEAILPGLIKSSARSVSSEDLVHSLQQAVLLVQRDSLAHTFLSKSEITALEQGFDAELQRRSK